LLVNEIRRIRIGVGPFLAGDELNSHGHTLSLTEHDAHDLCELGGQGVGQ
jgi:hypothetical protein